MTAATKPRLTGFCNPDLPAASHARCSGVYHRGPAFEPGACDCTCHQQPAAPAPRPTTPTKVVSGKPGDPWADAPPPAEPLGYRTTGDPVLAQLHTLAADTDPIAGVQIVHTLTASEVRRIVAAIRGLCAEHRNCDDCGRDICGRCRVDYVIRCADQAGRTHCHACSLECGACAQRSRDHANGVAQAPRPEHRVNEAD